MKNLFPFILLCTMVLKLTAQDITISFQPKEAGNTIDSIWVTNQRTNQKVKLTGSETLTLTKTTGIDIFQSFSESGCLYPNPCNGEAKLSFNTSGRQEVVLGIYNISGQLLSLERKYLEQGYHEFQVTFPGIGIYAVSVIKKEGSLSFKAICLDSKNQKCGTDYISCKNIPMMKSAVTEKTLSYSQGDVLNYSIFSGKNSTIITDSPVATKVYSVGFYNCTDPDNRSYKVVKIGEQVWMAENLAWLPAVSPPSAESVTDPYYYVYGYNGTDVKTAKAQPNYTSYGALYNWPAALAGSASNNQNPGGVRGVCPEGWHMPSDAEWTQLENYLIANGYNYNGTTTGNKIAKSLATATGWNSDSGIGTVGNTDYLSYRNKTGFSGLPGGYRYVNGSFFFNEGYGFWWSSAESSADHAWSRYLRYIDPDLRRDSWTKEYGFSVRCVRDKEPVTVLYEDFSWLNYGSAVPYTTTGETRYDAWTQNEKDKGWTSTVNEVSGSGNTPLCYARVGFVKLGKTGYGGDIISPKLSTLEGAKNVKVTFKAAAYVSSGGTVIDTRVLKIHILGAGKASVDSLMIENVPNNKAQDDAGIVNNIWDPARAFSFIITGATAETRIQFLGKAWDLTKEAVTTNRIFLDDIKVVVIE